MSTLKVSSIQSPSTTDGGLSISATGAVSGGLPTAGRSLTYNGAMQVAQRGTSATGITSTGYYTADRWVVGGGFGTWTQTIENDGPAGSGLTKSVKMLCTASGTPGAANVLNFQQRLEGQDVQRVAKGTAAAQQLTLSFWVKSNVPGTYIAELYDPDNTRQVSGSYAINSADTWEYKSITFPADTTGTWDNDNSASLQYLFWLLNGSDYTSGSLQTSWGPLVNANRAVGQTNLAAAVNNYWQITGVQLETGPVATEFEHRSFGDELARCQRYYQKSYSYTDAPGTASANGALVIAGMANSSTTTGNNNVGFRFESRMRTTPNVTSYRPDSGGSGELLYARHSTPAANATASVTRTNDTGSCIYTTNASGLTAGYAVELIFHWTADAEL